MITCCSTPNHHIVDSRPQSNWRRRRYECSNCHTRFTTVEIAVADDDSCLQLAARMAQPPGQLENLVAELKTLVQKFS